MRPFLPLFICFALVALAAGCEQKPTTSQQIDQLKTETQAAAQDLQDYTFARKAEFVETMEVQLAALKQDLDQLAAKVESSSDAVKADARPKLQALRDEVTQLDQHLDNVRNATESTWDSVKTTSQKAFDSLKDGFQQSRQWVSDKIAP